MKKVIIICLLFPLSLSLFSQENSHAFEVNERLGRGVNLGNLFEAPSETAWRNSWDPAYFKIIADLGFSHVRVPIRWEAPERSMTTAPYTISTDFLERIKSVVDEALSNNLHIIINMHHHETLYNDPDGQKARFLSQWQQIADYFKEYPDSLLFEILNEPQKKLQNAELWNRFAASALSEIRKTNPDRCVMICSFNWSGVNGLNLLEVPADDKNLILTVHYYNPYDFTHQQAEEGIEWLDTEIDRETVRQEFREVRAFSERHNIPVHVGEFSAYRTADMASRVRWMTFLTRYFEGCDYSWAYWEFNSSLGFYDAATQTFVQPLVDALLRNLLTPPVLVPTSVVYESDFENSGLNGWRFQATNDATASAAINDDVMEINVTTGGSQAWYIQLMKLNIPLENGQQYRLSLKASATNECAATLYVGRNASPWDAYSSYKPLLLSDNIEHFSYTFTMDSPDDANARINFDLGSTPATTISIRDLKLEIIQPSSTQEPDNQEPDGDVSNSTPSQDKFVITGGKEHISVLNAMGKMAFVYDIQGKLLTTKALSSDSETIPTPSGIFIIKVGDYIAQKVVVK